MFQFSFKKILLDCFKERKKEEKGNRQIILDKEPQKFLALVILAYQDAILLGSRRFEKN